MKALASAPDNCSVLGLLAVYLPLLKAAHFKILLAKFEWHALDRERNPDGASLLSAAQRKRLEAARACYATRVKKGVDSDAEQLFSDVPYRELQPWLPVACFLDLLEGGPQAAGKAVALSEKAVRACCGLAPDPPAGVVRLMK